MRIPARYRDDFVAVAIDAPTVVMATVGYRSNIAHRWKCNRCGKVIKQNAAAAQSHTAKHVREALKASA